MNDPNRRFWPFKPRTSIAFTVLILVCLLTIFIVLRATINWPSDKSETPVLIGILIFSLLPVLLALVDAIIERGGVIKAGGVEIDFSQVPQMGTSEFIVPVNIGISGQSVADSSTTEILDALKQATACDVVIIDLEDGQAWWETRLLVLLVGAVRLQKPQKLVFIGKDRGIDKCFQGWGHPRELLPLLLQAHPQYLRSYHAAKAAARQWELVEPTGDVANPPRLPFTQKTIEKYNFQDDDLVLKLLKKGIIKSVSYQPNLTRFDDSIADESQLRQRLKQIAGIEIDPIVAIWKQSSQAGLAEQHPWMAFDNTTGLHNPLLTEQLLANDLGQRVEEEEEPKRISLVRLEELFRSVLYTEIIDDSWPAERQLHEFLNSGSDYLAVTQEGRYLTMVSKLNVLNSIVRILAEKK
ncbi:MAG: hypothetical protein ACFFDT_08655 [Candidatus Hodarchaeota archaeon]